MGLGSVADSRGSALLIVLAFLLLLTTLSVAFLTRATLERQLSNASFNQNKVDLAGQGAITSIIGDLQREIAAGSNGNGSSIVAGTNIPDLTQGGTVTGYYYPNSPATVIPAIVGFTPASGVENLLKISYQNSAFYSGTYYNTGTYPAPDRASSIPTTKASLNYRAVSNARWNKPLLMAPINAATAVGDLTPPAAFITPDWIYVARDGSNPGAKGGAWSSAYQYLSSVAPTTATSTTAGTNPVTQRYAYTIYDEGSTLDMNVAGSPMTAAGTYSTNQPYKNALAYADLTQLPFLSTAAQTVAGASTTTLTAAQQQTFINAIVGWRNFASAGLANSNKFPAYTITAANATSFDKNVIFNPSGFLNTGNPTVATGAVPIMAGPNKTGSANQTDNAFVSRQQLIQFFLQGLGQNTTFTGSVPLASLESVLPYLGTFSRDINQPSYAPSPAKVTAAPTATTANGGNNIGTGAATVDSIINPALLATTVTTAYTRNDGSTSVVGEPLVKKRFALSRLAWVTCNGAIANDSGTLNPSSDTTIAKIITTLEGAPYYYSAAFLAQGGPTNIYKYFGLSWVPDSTSTRTNGDGLSKWVYNHELASYSSTLAAATATTHPIRTLSTGSYTVTSKNRDADFFELLKAGTTLGSLGKAYLYTASPSSTSTSGYQMQRDNAVDLQILQMGANIIDQFQPSGYCARILFTDGSLFGGIIQEIRGIEDLPYFYRVREGEITVTDSSPSLATLPTTSTSTVTSPGKVAVLQEPEIWNPHAWNKNNPDTNPRPTSFRCVAISTDPNSASSTAVAVTPSLGSLNPYNTPNPGSNTPSTPNGAWNESNTELDFSIPTGDLYLFREPTLLIKPGIPTNSNLASGSSTLLKAAFSAGYIASLWKSAQITNNGGTDNQQYIGFLAGTGPAAWAASIPVGSLDGTNPAAVTAGVTNATDQYLSTAVNGITYRMQYQDTSGNWITYDEKYADYQAAWSFGRGTNWSGQGGLKNYIFNSTSNAGSTQDQIIGNEIGEVCFDPRTSRFGMNQTGPNGFRAGGYDQDLPPKQSNYALGWAASNGTSLVSSGTYLTGAIGQLAIASERPDINAGFQFSTNQNSPGAFLTTGPTATGWYPAVSASTVIAPGLIAQNITTGPTTQTWSQINTSLSTAGFQGPDNEYFADADGVVRRGMSAYVPSSNNPPATAPASGQPTGVPTVVATDYSGATPAPFASEQPSRPIMLNRPFRSVGDLTYVFSGTPWRNLDMSTPESAASALLDVFCINDTNDPNNLVAGKVNLNTRQSSVLAAVVAGAYTDEFGPTGTASSGNFTTPTVVSFTYASAIATALVNRTQSTNTSINLGPLVNPADLVGKWYSTTTVGSPSSILGSSSYTGLTADINSSNTTTAMYDLTQAQLKAGLTGSDVNTRVQRFRDAPIRALANAGTTRVWNLMIDVIAQTGRFPSSATAFDKFNVEGERRYWVHVAIDRYTGKVLDEQIEEVKE